MSEGIFYGVGVGPGDPELLTLRAARIIGEADLVVVPRPESDKESAAWSIAREHIREGCPVIKLVFPMTRDSALLDEAWERAAREIEGHLRRGKKVVFLTVGDPMLYSTYIYIFRRIKEAGCTVHTVPGVPSFCAAAAAAGMPLAEGDEKMAVVTWNARSPLSAGELEPFSSLVIMKASADLDGIIDTLQAAGFLQHSVLASRCGYADERVETELRSLKGTAVPYFSLILARKEEK